MKLKVLPKKDLKNFWEIQKEYSDKWDFDYLEEEYSRYSELYIGCYDGERLIGIAYGFVRGNIVTLQGIAVIHERWRRGIGTKILKFFENRVKLIGKKTVGVGSAEGFVEKFYLKCGYRPVEIQAKDKWGKIVKKERVESYEDGIRKREKLKKLTHPKEIIFIMEKNIS